MNMTCNLCKNLAAAAAFALLTPLAAADMHGDKEKHADQAKQTQHAGQAQQASQGQQGEQNRQAKLKDAVSVQTLLGASVQNVTTPIGNVRDVILTEDRSAVEYVLYEVPYPYSAVGAQNGFVAFDNVAIEAGATLDTNLRIDDEAAARAPQELTLTRAEADHRMVSRILEDEVFFSGEEEVRDVEDILIDRDSGEVLGYVVNRNPDAWFNDEPAMVSPSDVTIKEDGNVTTSAEFAALESLESLDQ